MSPQRTAIQRLLLTGWILVLVVSGGCSSLDSRKDPMASYDESSEESGNFFKKMTDKVKELAGYGPNRELARQLFEEGQALYAEALRLRPDDLEASRTQFVAAAEKFDEAADRWPDSALQEEAWHLLGESYFFADHYPGAEDAYGRLAKKYSRTRHMDAAQARRFTIAQYWLQKSEEEYWPPYLINVSDAERPRFDAFGNAMRVFDRIRLDDPTGKLADDATMALANANFKARRFDKADEYYTDLRRTFPSSEHQFNAHFLGLKAKLECYQGVEYSGQSLEESEKLLQQIRRQFPAEAQQEKEFLARTGGEIRYRKAEREWHRAERHERRAEYGAARMYYDTLVKDFRETPFGEKAAQRLNEISDEPDVPPQPMSWLVHLFPERQTVKPLVASQTPTTTRR